MYFSEVRIDKVRGIGRGEGFVLNQLSPGINIIYGPNASGKSTTSRVLQELLWPGRTGLGPAAIQGILHHDKSQFVIEGDAGHFEVFRDGAPAPPPDCGPPENRVRYNPALHELIQADNQGHDFARRIAEASQGGFDLTAASQALGYQDSPPAKRRESQALREINDHLKSVERFL